jgi:tetratricopeptide (TPR) repeat protein
MRKTLLPFAFALLIVVSAVVAAPARQKVIKDPQEYNAYITALNTQDSVQKAAAMETFVKQYPISIVKIEALEQLMSAYQQAGNAALVEDAAKRILALEPNNIRALAIMTFLERGRASQGDATALTAIQEDSKRGILALAAFTKPDDSSDAEFKTLHDQMTKIFYGAAGFGALQSKDYAQARANFLRAVEIEPADLQDVYQLSIAQLQSSPIDVNGFWYLAKAFNLSKGNSAGQQSIAQYGKAKYHKFHGGDDGWDQILASAEKESSPSKDFSSSIKPAPTAEENAVKAVQENDPATLSFGDMEFILQYRDSSAANKAAAGKVWQSVQDKQKGGATKIRMDVTVISATRRELQVAITDENQRTNKADMKITLESPLASPPAPRSIVTATGVITDYTPSPFMFFMTKADVAPAAKSPVPPK